MVYGNSDSWGLALGSRRCGRRDQCLGTAVMSAPKVD
jgi:hypothetical protein